MFWTTAAYAMGAGGSGASGDASGIASFVPLILMFAVFYFLLIRPQQKKAKEHRAMVSALKRGDEVITSGGMYGRIVETGEETVVVDLGDSKVKMLRSAISAVPSTPSKPVDKKSKKEVKKADKPEPAKSETSETEQDDK